MKKAHILKVEGKSANSVEFALVEEFNKWSEENSTTNVTVILEPRRWSRYPYGDTTYYGSLTFFYEVSK